MKCSTEMPSPHRKAIDSLTPQAPFSLTCLEEAETNGCSWPFLFAYVVSTVLMCYSGKSI